MACRSTFKISNGLDKIKSKSILTRLKISIAVVAQQYESEAENEYVIRGNNVILKCKIPSFVADFLQIVAWLDSDGQEYTAQTTSHGKSDADYYL